MKIKITYWIGSIFLILFVPQMQAEDFVSISTSKVQLKTSDCFQFDSILVNGTVINLSCSLDYGYHFKQWSDGVKENSRSIIIRNDISLIAEYERNSYILTINENMVEGKTAGITKGTGTYLYLDTILIEAEAFYGYHFEQWNDGVMDNPRKVILSKDSVFSATFAKNTYNLSYKANDDKRGEIIGSSSAFYLDKVTLCAVPNYGYHFSQWSDGETVNPRSIIVTQDTIFTAIFNKNVYSLQVISADESKGTVLGSTSAEYLDSLEINATPKGDYIFYHWSDGSQSANRMIELKCDTSIIAYFGTPNCHIAATSDFGYVEGSGIYPYGSNITLTVVPSDHYHFVKWSDGNTNNPRHVKVEGDATYTAINEIDQHRVIANAIHGYVDGSRMYDYGSFVTLTAQPDNGYRFVKWSNGNEFDPYVFVIEDDVTIDAIFELITDALDEISAPTQPRKVMIGGNIFMQVNNDLYDIIGNKIK